MLHATSHLVFQPWREGEHSHGVREREKYSQGGGKNTVMVLYRERVKYSQGGRENIGMVLGRGQSTVRESRYER